MGAEVIKFLQERKILFQSSTIEKKVVAFLRAAYEQVGPQIIIDVRDYLDAHMELKAKLEDAALAWPDNDAGVTGPGGFFDQMTEEIAEAVVNYINDHSRENGEPFNSV